MQNAIKFQKLSSKISIRFFVSLKSISVKSFDYENVSQIIG
jgi:hypothetical protein